METKFDNINYKKLEKNNFTHCKEHLNKVFKIAKKELGNWDFDELCENDKYWGWKFIIDTSYSYENVIYQGIGVREVQCEYVEREEIFAVAINKANGNIIKKRITK
jgi:hypothetical protein